MTFAPSSCNCHKLSPSLRGSGLKFVLVCEALASVRLPLYEGVDWNSIFFVSLAILTTVSLFTREWIEILSWYYGNNADWGLPLYEGVDWNPRPLVVGLWLFVSLFTREWIEIEFATKKEKGAKASPSLRGSGLKWHLPLTGGFRRLSPSLRGSGLKW